MTDPHTTHHYGCECREAVMREMAKALEKSLFYVGKYEADNECNTALAVHSEIVDALDSYRKIAE